jgi:hypothetical protein
VRNCAREAGEERDEIPGKVEEKWCDFRLLVKEGGREQRSDGDMCEKDVNQWEEANFGAVVTRVQLGVA